MPGKLCTWEMQQLGRRAGALDINLMSNQPRKQTGKLLSSLLGVVLEKDGRCSRAAPYRLARSPTDLPAFY